jgi:hypothetical protein
VTQLWLAVLIFVLLLLLLLLVVVVVVIVVVVSCYLEANRFPPIVPMLGMSGTLPPLPHTPAGRERGQVYFALMFPVQKYYSAV